MFAAKDTLLTRPSGYQISRSVRVRQSASAYLNRTPASATNRKTWTWSGWVKIGKASTTGLFVASTSGSNYYTIQLDVGGQLLVYAYIGTYPYFRLTSAVFRDYSAWYHFVVAFDSTQATDTDRIKIYANGVLQSTTSGSGSGWPTLNYDGGVNNTINHQFSNNVGGSSYFDGYLAEVNFVDGQQLTPSSFGETNAVTGVWQPKKYAGTYGTNGFYLNFNDNSAATAAAIGKDSSGNGNNFTPSAGISVTAGVTYDSMLDVPTPYADGGNGRGNYCVLNPTAYTSVATRTSTSNGNLSFSDATTANTGVIGTMGSASGKYYFELTSSSTGVYSVGLIDFITKSSSFYRNNGSYSSSFGGGGTTGYSSWTTGDVIGVAWDADAGKIWFAKNNTFQSGSPSAGTSPTNTFTANLVLTASIETDNSAGTKSGSINFGQRPFTYTPPTGFVALNTQNLPAPTISNGANYMAATLYTGTNSAQTITNSGGFQPDFVWAKSRSNATGHVLVDSVRGIGNVLSTNNTNDASQEAAGYGLTAFNSNGFSVGIDNAGQGSINASTYTYVAWQWKAGGTAVSNTSGSITSTVSAGATQGFSVVTYTGNGSTGTVGHGLGVAPKMLIVKKRNSATSSNWMVWHISIGTGFALNLNTTGSSGATYWNNTAPTSTVFSLDSNANYNSITDTFVAYCFAAVAGYSAFGSYTGNNSADGPFVYLGFRPRWIMFKDSSSVAVWMIMDTARNTINALDDGLAPNNANAESTYSNIEQVDFLSNGFKIRATNANQYWANVSGNTYIYAAFAENPFKNSLAR